MNFKLFEIKQYFYQTLPENNEPALPTRLRKGPTGPKSVQSAAIFQRRAAQTLARGAKRPIRAFSSKKNGKSDTPAANKLNKPEYCSNSAKTGRSERQPDAAAAFWPAKRCVKWICQWTDLRWARELDRPSAGLLGLGCLRTGPASPRQQRLDHSSDSPKR